MIFVVTKIVEMPFRLQVFFVVPMYKNVELKSSFLHNTLGGLLQTGWEVALISDFA